MSYANPSTGYYQYSSNNQGNQQSKLSTPADSNAGNTQPVYPYNYMRYSAPMNAYNAPPLDAYNYAAAYSQYYNQYPPSSAYPNSPTSTLPPNPYPYINGTMPHLAPASQHAGSSSYASASYYQPRGNVPYSAATSRYQQSDTNPYTAPTAYYQPGIKPYTAPASHYQSSDRKRDRDSNTHLSPQASIYANKVRKAADTQDTRAGSPQQLIGPQPVSDYYPPPPYPILSTRKNELLERVPKISSMSVPTFNAMAIDDQFQCTITMVLNNETHYITGGCFKVKKSSEHHASWKALQLLDTLIAANPELAQPAPSTAAKSNNEKATQGSEIQSDELSPEDQPLTTPRQTTKTNVPNSIKELKPLATNDYKSAINEMAHQKDNRMKATYNSYSGETGFRCLLRVEFKDAEFEFHSDAYKKKRDAEHDASRRAIEFLQKLD